MEQQDQITHETVVDCGASLDISQAMALHTRLTQLLTSGIPIIFNAREVRRVDTAMLQMLTAFFRAARTQGITVAWREPSDILRDGSRLLGLAEELMLA